jgi:hypothetical protein
MSVGMKETGVISKLISRAVAAVVVLALGFVAGYVVKGITTTHEHEHVVGDSNQPQAETADTSAEIWKMQHLPYGSYPGINRRQRPRAQADILL